MKSCSKCTTPSSPDNSSESSDFASIEEARCTTALSHPESEEVCRIEEIVTTTEGGDASKFTDAVETREMTLLGRLGKKLAKLVGTGYLQIEDGVARLVPSIPLRITHLYHRWVIPAPGQRPVLGESKPAAHLAIIDEKGKAFAVKGLEGEDCSVVWDHEAKGFVVRPLTDQKISTKGVLRKEDQIELMGLRPPSSKCYDKAREVKALKGEGVVFLTNKSGDGYPDDVCCDDEKCEECRCDDHKVKSLASVVPYPDDSSETVYGLAWNFQEGLHFTDQGTGGGGEDGAKGEKGDTGAVGPTGPVGPIGPIGRTGDSGPEGARGPIGPAGSSTASAALSRTPVDSTFLIQAPVVPNQTLTAEDNEIKFSNSSHSSDEWEHIAGSSIFALTASDPQFAEIKITLTYASTPPNVLLYRNGSLVDMTTSIHKGTEKIAQIHFIDADASSGASYKLVTQSGTDAPTAGTFQAKAIIKVDAVTGVTINNS